MLPTDMGLHAELWLVMASRLFEALVAEGEIEGDTLTVPVNVKEELEDNWGMVRAAFKRAGYEIAYLTSPI